MKCTTTRIYQRCMQLIELVQQVLVRMPQGHSDLANQLKRAAASIPLNYAEGCGKRTHRDRQKYFHIARGSAYEVFAIFDVAERFGAVEHSQAEVARDCADHIAGMLTKFR